MAEFNRKNKSSFWHSPFVLLALFCFLIIFSYNIIGLFEKKRETAKKKELILSQIEVLNNREKIITQDINKLKTEEGVEETIREKYQVVKEGERMVIIVDQENKEELENSSVEVKNNFWDWLKRKFNKNN